MSTIQILFLFISVLGVLTALGTVLARNLVHAALYLVAFFFVIACQFVLLEAEFLAAMQVLVYIGAVSILIMFGIMLTRNIQGDETLGGHWAWKVPAVIVALGVLAVLVAGINGDPGRPGVAAWGAIRERPGGLNPSIEGPAAEQAAVINDMARVIGVELMTRHVVAFEVAGLLLTAALVGAIALSRREGVFGPAGRVGSVATVASGKVTAPLTSQGNGHVAPSGVTKTEALISSSAPSQEPRGPSTSS
ncbi:hypothetical protein BH23PLA1_BH23PLA1_15280 [soil metagenome]